MVAALINQKDNMIEGIRYAQEVIEGSMTMLILTPKGILAARDRLGRTPLIVGKKERACCVSFESFAYLNLGYEDLKELGPGEIVAVTPDGVETLQKPGGRDANLFFPLGILRISYFGIRGCECRRNALSLR